VLLTMLARLGDKVRLPLNSERLEKLTGSFIVSNEGIKTVLSLEHMPLSAREGLRRVCAP